MLGITAGIIIAVLILWVLLAFIREIAIVGLYVLGFCLLMVTFCFACWGATGVFHWLSSLIGHDAAEGIANAIMLIGIFITLRLLWFDSRENYAFTKRICKAMWRVCKSSTWEAWRRRYRLVTADSQPEILGYSPYLWTARILRSRRHSQAMRRKHPTFPINIQHIRDGVAIDSSTPPLESLSADAKYHLGRR